MFRLFLCCLAIALIPGYAQAFNVPTPVSLDRLLKDGASVTAGNILFSDFSIMDKSGIHPGYIKVTAFSTMGEDGRGQVGLMFVPARNRLLVKKRSECKDLGLRYSVRSIDPLIKITSSRAILEGRITGKAIGTIRHAITDNTNTTADWPKAGIGHIDYATSGISVTTEFGNGGERINFAEQAVIQICA